MCSAGGGGWLMTGRRRRDAAAARCCVAASSVFRNTYLTYYNNIYPLTRPVYLRRFFDLSGTCPPTRFSSSFFFSSPLHTRSDVSDGFPSTLHASHIRVINALRKHAGTRAPSFRNFPLLLSALCYVEQHFRHVVVSIALQQTVNCTTVQVITPGHKRV